MVFIAVPDDIAGRCPRRKFILCKYHGFKTLPPGKRVGVITISKDVTPEHLESVGVPLDIPLVGTENGKTFTASVLDDGDSMNVELAREDLVSAANELVGGILRRCDCS